MGASTVQTAVVIDDDPDIRRLLAEILTSAGFVAITADNGVDGINAVLEHQPVITTLDINMPGMDGFETARRIREGSDTYIVLITALTDEADAVLGFGVGADDVVVKPFRPRELRARLIAMARRPRSVNITEPLGAPATGATTAATIAHPVTTSTGSVLTAPTAASGLPLITRHEIRYPGLVLDRQTRTLTIDGVDITLTRTEFDLLATILESERRVRSKADLVLTLRDESYLDPAHVSEADERTIEAHVTNLRRKIGESAAQPRFIETVRGVGYRAIISPVIGASGS